MLSLQSSPHLGTVDNVVEDVAPGGCDGDDLVGGVQVKPLALDPWVLPVDVVDDALKGGGGGWGGGGYGG